MSVTPVKILSMRQSTMGTANTCLKRIEFIQNPNIPRKGNVNRSVGTGYHAGLAYYYAERMRTGLWFPPRDGSITVAAIEAFDADVAEADEFDWTFQPKTYRLELVVFKREDAINTIQAALTKYFVEELMWEPEWNVKGVELSFDLPYDGIAHWKRTGTIDLALQHSETAANRLVDHKTAKKKWAKDKGGATNPQAAWYLDAYRSLTGLEADFVYDVMGLVDGSFERRSAPRTEAQIQATLEQGRDLARLIDQGGPFMPNPDSFLCSEHWCDFWKVCPFGQTLKTR